MAVADRCSARQIPSGARLLHQIPVLGISLYVVDPADRGSPSRWLAVDAAGEVRPVASSDLLLLARLQMDTLVALRCA